MTATAITLASIVGTIQIVWSEECVATIVIIASLMVDSISTLISILPHKPTAKEGLGSLG